METNTSQSQSTPSSAASFDLKNILLQENYLSPEDMQKAEEYASNNKTSLLDALLHSGSITKELLGQAIAEYYKVEFMDLDRISAPSEMVHKIPENIARAFLVVVVDEQPTELVVATSNPLIPQMRDALQSLFPQKPIKFVYALPQSIEAQFVVYRKSLSTRFADIISSQKRVAPEIIGQIVSDAISLRASDIHFEPQEKETIVRFRIDGMLQEAGRIPKEFYENILNRIKVLSHLRIDEHFDAQDGAVRFSLPTGFVDMRVSLVPTIDGEKIAIRILSEYVRTFSFAELGLTGSDEEALTSAAKKPFGMIVLAGPTGSGKTTTLYALLKMLNTPTVNITTIEDPVEYKVAGINQIQVNNQTNLTFAKGLKTIVRQDPDIILVGEVRDLETTEIAVNAALTGHLLLTTFHANDAATAIPRLLDMGVEPFLLASTLELVMAQRLVRKLCEVCRVSITMDVNQLGKVAKAVKHFYTEQHFTIYQAKGCNSCNHTGYKGRVAIYEQVQITPEMQELILTHPSTAAVWELARRQGSKSLFEDGFEKVKSGITTMEEVTRVAKIPNVS